MIFITHGFESKKICMNTPPLMKLPMGRRAFAILAFCGLWGGLASAPVAVAAPFIETVQGFALGSNQPDCTLVKDAFGRYYGTTFSGGGPGGFGGPGTIFRVSASGNISTLHFFNYSEGAGPVRGLTAGTDGNFYGITLQGGDADVGTAFRIAPDGSFALLHSFSGQDGAKPSSRLLLASDGNFYGTTLEGGSQGLGTVFRLTHAGEMNTLVSFGADTVGNRPFGDLVEGQAGVIHGTNSSSGSPGSEGPGTVFSVSFGGNASLVASFAGMPFTSTSFPNGLTKAADGNLYGTTPGGGTHDRGTIFKVTPAGVLSEVSEFGPQHGRSPGSALAQAKDGSLYGTTYDGGDFNSGTVFKLSPSGELTTLASFEAGTAGPSYPAGGLIQVAPGAFVGTSTSGGVNGIGTMFRVSSRGALSVKASFHGVPNHSPDSKMIQGEDGTFYGTTATGLYEKRAIFKMSPKGKISSLMEVEQLEGKIILGWVDSKRKEVYGVLTNGGELGVGLAFKVDWKGKMTPLYSFEEISAFPNSLVKGSDGNWYGTTREGGTHLSGSFFRLTEAGVFTTLSEFDPETSRFPNPGLIEASDGNFYGTTEYGGTKGEGIVFKISRLGEFTVLANFGENGTSGGWRNSGLVEGSDSNFYGILPRGGPSDAGSVYKVTPEGVLSILSSFELTNGQLPVGELVEGPDGALYGCTTDDEIDDSSFGGTVFRIPKTGGISTVYFFDYTHGSYPLAGLTKGRDGYLYGTASEGGVTSTGEWAGGGQIFRIGFDSE